MCGSQVFAVLMDCDTQHWTPFLPLLFIFFSSYNYHVTDAQFVHLSLLQSLFKFYKSMLFTTLSIDKSARLPVIPPTQSVLTNVR